MKNTTYLTTGSWSSGYRLRFLGRLSDSEARNWCTGCCCGGRIKGGNLMLLGVVRPISPGVYGRRRCRMCRISCRRSSLELGEICGGSRSRRRGILGRLQLRLLCRIRRDKAACGLRSRSIGRGEGMIGKRRRGRWMFLCLRLRRCLCLCLWLCWYLYLYL